MKMSYKLAWEIKELAAFIFNRLDYSYNGYTLKYNGNESKFINQIIKEIKQLKKIYNWSNRRVFNFVNLVYMQWTNLDNPEEIALLDEFEGWKDMLRYIDMNLQLQYWPTEDLMKKKI